MIRARLGRLRRRFRYWLDDTRLAGPRVLKALARSAPQAVFVEVGANDGTMMDPLHKVIARSRWHGLALEPVPELFARLEQHYQPIRDRVTPLNLALSTQEGILPFNCLRNQPGEPPLPDWAHGLGSFERQVILGHADRIPRIERYIEQIDVRCTTWAQLVREQALTRLDILMVDTEGHDLMVLRQIDLVQWRPALVIYEHHHLDAASRSEAQHKFIEAEYRLFEEGLDTWCLDTRAGSLIGPTIRRRLDGWLRRSRYAKPVQRPLQGLAQSSKPCG